MVSITDFIICPVQQEWVAGVPIPAGLTVIPNPGGLIGAPVTYVAAGLPNGVTLSSDGILSGTPTETQTMSEVHITATDHFGDKYTCNFSVAVLLEAAETIDLHKVGFEYQASYCGTQKLPGDDLIMYNPVSDALAGLALFYV